MSIFKTCNFVVLLLSLVVADVTRSVAVNYDGTSIKEVAEHLSLSDCPFWDSEHNILYFVDNYEHRVYRYCENRLEHIQLDDNVGFIIPIAGEQNLFVIALDTTLSTLRWNLDETTAGDIVRLTTVDKDKPHNRLNDGKADNNGYLWAGTMGQVDSKLVKDSFEMAHGNLYMFTDDTNCFQNLQPAVTNISISNGLAWSEDNTRMFYIDSLTRKISVFDYHPDTVSISNRRTFYDLNTDQLPGIPTGMTIDANGDLWVANFNGAQVLHVCGTSGKLLGKLIIAAKKVSSVTFGGPQLDKLYVTTIGYGVTEDELKEYPMSGKVLEVSGLGVNGTPNRRVRAKCFKPS